MHRSLWRTLATTTAATTLVLTAGAAFADNLKTDLAASGPTTVTLSGGTASTTIKVFAQDTGGTGCDVSAANPAVYQPVTAAGVTAPNVTLSACGSPSGTDQRVPVTFTATAPGSYAVTWTRVSGPTLNTGPGNFTLTVNGVSNTAPTVTVEGVADGATYEYGAVPAAVCQVDDEEDGASSFAASLSDVTGDLAAYGLGSQTASCEYTDEGDETRSASATYSIVDTTDPELSAPGDQTLEATGPDGAEATWTATATDNVHVADVSCDVTSPHTFGLGTHTVTCTATDVAGNTDSGSFTVKVQDTGKPTLLVSNDVTEEATGPDGAVVTYDAPTASDTVDTSLDPSCSPASGSTFALGETTVECSVTDDSGNTSTGSFTVTVQDTTAPVLSLPADLTLEMTSPDGATATWTATSTDAVSGSPEVTCSPESGSTFGYGTTTVSCSATDEALNTGSGTFEVTVEDTTPPEIADNADLTVEATGADGALVTYDEPAATDAASETVVVDCIPESGTQFDLGTTSVNCTATDAHGLTSSSSFDVLVQDTTAPTLQLPTDIAVGAVSASGTPVSFTATAADAVDPDVPVTCTPASGSTFAPGATTVSCSATDDSGNTANGTFKVTVSFGFTGFYAPVDNGGVLNTIKGGQSVPMKWSVPNGSGGWIGSLGIVSGVTQTQITCGIGTGTDEIEAPTSGSTSLRYDTTANQFIYNWQSPKVAGNCYKVTVKLTDGTVRSALFKTR